MTTPMYVRWMLRRDVRDVLLLAPGWVEEGSSFPNALLPMLRLRNTIGMVATRDYPGYPVLESFREIHGFIVYKLCSDHLLVHRMEGSPEALAAMLLRTERKLAPERRSYIAWEHPADFAASLGLEPSIPLWALADALEDVNRISDAMVCRAINGDTIFVPEPIMKPTYVCWQSLTARGPGRWSAAHIRNGDQFTTTFLCGKQLPRSFFRVEYTQMGQDMCPECERRVKEINENAIQHSPVSL